MEDISLESLLRQYITNTVNGLFTAVPAKVVGQPNLKQQRVDVQILIDRVTSDGISRPHTIITGVPLMFQGSRTSQFSFPVKEGEVVLCVFSQRSIDRFKLGAVETHKPLDFRKYSKADAIAIPGLFPFTQAPNDPAKRTLDHSTEDAVLTHNIGTENECEVRLQASGGIVINAPSNSVEVNCSDSVVNASVSSTVNTETSTINATSSTVNCDTSEVTASGSATIKAASVAVTADSDTTITSPSTTIQGPLTVTGPLTFSGGMSGSAGVGGGAAATLNGGFAVTGTIEAAEVTAGGISLTDHAHIDSQGGATTSPQ